VDRAEEVEADDRLGEPWGGAVGGGRRTAPGVVHGEVEPAVVRCDRGDQRVDLLGLAHVGGAELVGGGGRRGAAADHDGGPGLGQAVGDRRADPLRAPRDEGDPPGQVDGDRHEGSVYQTN
jgi:hypothetical protein